jgi:hypothetical protein
VSSGYKQENGYDGAHRGKTIRGLRGRKRTRPEGSTDTAAIAKDNSATRFNNWYDAMAF